VRLARFDVLGGVERQRGLLRLGQRTDHLGRRTKDQRTRGRHESLSHQGVGSHQAAIADLGAIKNSRAHANQAVVSNLAGMDDRRMANGGAPADSNSVVVRQVNDGAILHIGFLANLDEVDVPAEDAAIPDTAPCSQRDIAHHRGGRRDKYRAGSVGGASEMTGESFLNGHDNLVLAGSPALRKLGGTSGFPSPMDTLHHVGRGLLGIAALLGIAVLLSDNRRGINWRIVGMGLGLQLAFAGLVIFFGPARAVVEWVGGLFVDLLGFTRAGVGFVFGSLADQEKHGVIFAIGILPSIIFFSAISSALYYLGILQKLVYAFAWVMAKTMKLSGAESLSASANMFLGQTEAPLLIKPYLPTMNRSELLCIMTGGMATIAGAVMLAYISFLGGSDPAQQILFATHLITASVISAPAALMVSKILVPQTEEVQRELVISKEKIGTNLLDALCLGTTDGLRLAVNVGAMLIVFTALIALVNALLGWLGGPHTLIIGGRELFAFPGLGPAIDSLTGGAFQALSLEFLLGILYAPIAWLIGIDSRDLLLSGSLLGTRTVLNEFVAYLQMGQLKAAGSFNDPRTLLILTYALCGFANFVSIGIQVGGIGAIAPSQRENLARLGMKSMIGGTIACLLTASVAGMMI